MVSHTSPVSASFSAPLPQGDARLTLLTEWLASLSTQWECDLSSLAPASSDASFRRYFRVNSASSAHPTLIVMDAPPSHEDCKPFIHVAQLFCDAGVNVPQVLAKNLEAGFLLLSDLGNSTYLSVLEQRNAFPLYTDATHALLTMQQASRPDVLPNYDRPMLQQEMELFPTWYIEKHLGATLTKTQHADVKGVFEVLLRNVTAQGQTYVHRDYHSRNLMVTPERNPGVLDFQDAVYGPLTYDLVSLWRDAYIEWDEEQQLDYLARYWERAKKIALPVPLDFGEFYRDYEWMGLQRHLKVLGIFARLYHRDGKDGYLKNLPLVLKYTRKVCERYSEFFVLARLLTQLEGKEVDVGFTF